MPPCFHSRRGPDAGHRRCRQGISGGVGTYDGVLRSASWLLYFQSSRHGRRGIFRGDRGRHQAPKRGDADGELGAYGIANICVSVFGAPMSVGIPARSVASVRCGGTTRISNLMHGVFLFLLVRLGSGALAHIPLVALAGVTAWMGLCLLDVSTWRRLPRMRPLDAGAFVVTVAGVLLVNPVAAVLAGCSLYAAQYLYHRYAGAASGMTGVPSVAK